MSDILDDLKALGERMSPAWHAHFDGFQAQPQWPEGVTVSVTCSACPVQMEGRIGDKHFYFRARWDSWRFAVADSVKEAIRAKPFRHGEHDNASWMPAADAWEIVLRCIEEYREADVDG